MLSLLYFGGLLRIYLCVVLFSKSALLVENSMVKLFCNTMTSRSLVMMGVKKKRLSFHLVLITLRP